MPTTLALGLFGIIRAFRQRFRRQADRKSSLTVMWVIVAYFVFIFIEPTGLGMLFVIVPMSILAMRSMQFVVERRIRDRNSFWLMILTLITFVFCGTPTLTENILSILRQWFGFLSQDALGEQSSQLGWQLLRIHLAMDVVVAGAAITFWLYRASSRRDRYHRLLFGGFSFLVIGGAIAFGTSPLMVSRRRRPLDRAGPDSPKTSETRLSRFPGKAESFA